MDEMLTFEVTISFNDRVAWSTTFLAEAWADALPQAMEIIEASLSAQDDHIVDIKIDRVAG